MMLTREDILEGRTQRALSENGAVEYGIDLRLRKQAVATLDVPEHAVYDRLAEEAWYEIYGDLMVPIHDLISAAKRASRAEHYDQLAAPIDRVLDILKYR